MVEYIFHVEYVHTKSFPSPNSPFGGELAETRTGMEDIFIADSCIPPLLVAVNNSIATEEPVVLACTL